ncbi:MAG: NUDIX domain-containing protein [Planctomycetia bacterium]|nr:NUDIX domain-containing protein [Planctomycetia bacterium]
MALDAIPFPAPSSIDQVCAIPFRTAAEQIEFCLITASSGRWLFPKGFVEPGDTFVEAALKEALEEAGLHGRVVGEPIGCYEIEKKGRPRTVIAMLMEVSHCDEVWKEVDVRKRRWATATEAFRLVSEPQLLELLCAADTRLRAA